MRVKPPEALHSPTPPPPARRVHLGAKVVRLKEAAKRVGAESLDISVKVGASRSGVATGGTNLNWANPGECPGCPPGRYIPPGGQTTSHSIYCGTGGCSFIWNQLSLLKKSLKHSVGGYVRKLFFPIIRVPLSLKMHCALLSPSTRVQSSIAFHTTIFITILHASPSDSRNQ